MPYEESTVPINEQCPSQVVPASLKLRLSVSDNQDTHPHLSYRFKAEVTEAVNISPAIFVYQSLAPFPSQANPQPRFSHVATPVDMEDWGEDEDLDEQFFRKSEIDVFVRSPQMAKLFREEVLRRTRLLVQGMNDMANLFCDSEVTFNFDVIEDDVS